MSRIYLSLGSNIAPEKNIPSAIELLKKNLTVLAVSSIYETDPVGPAGNQKFWNLAAAIETLHDRDVLTKKIREIEALLGRTRGTDKFAPRTLDIDILPQPGYQTFAFIMVPLAEIAPHEKDPETGKSFAQLAGKLNTEGCRKIS